MQAHQLIDAVCMKATGYVSEVETQVNLISQWISGITLLKSSNLLWQHAWTIGSYSVNSSSAAGTGNIITTVPTEINLVMLTELPKSTPPWHSQANGFMQEFGSRAQVVGASTCPASDIFHIISSTVFAAPRTPRSISAEVQLMLALQNVLVAGNGQGREAACLAIQISITLIETKPSTRLLN
ncbi:hypothetical protein MUK42_34372 [Musa troglodytarum]|uniref:Uncharacterized protein n=1 Tax=Musa troglodytarum TaxID=320322 RepID=A0A9E7G0D6_9LILI|nr:hypothetical protein MUK42_34372 [Musa troglodytarum]